MKLNEVRLQDTLDGSVLSVRFGHHVESIQLRNGLEALDVAARLQAMADRIRQATQQEEKTNEPSRLR